jgi:hypothetical protein
VLAQALEKLLAAAQSVPGAERNSLEAVDTFQFDVVNVTRQLLGLLAAHFGDQLQVAIQGGDHAALDRAGRQLLELIDDMDVLLATRPEFLLGRWLEDAKRWGATAEERRLYERNARNIITLWGPPDSVLHEYANRQWSGMFSSFYRPRWEKYLDARRGALDAKQPFDAGRLEKELRAWEDQWTQRTESFPTVPQGAPVATARCLWAKYQPAFRQSLEPEVVSLTTGKPTSCSHALPPYPARVANDGRRRNTNRFWATDVNVSKEAWWQVDFERPTTVGRVVVVGYFGDARYYGFTIEISTDGQRWDMVADRRDNKEPSTAAGYACPFEPRAVRYLRVTQTQNSANSGRHLVEVMAYER